MLICQNDGGSWSDSGARRSERRLATLHRSQAWLARGTGISLWYELETGFGFDFRRA